MKEFNIKSIGIIHTPWKSVEDVPVQPAGANNAKGFIEVYKEFAPGIKDLEGFSHITLIYKFHKIKNHELEVIPFMDTESHGVFSTRAPKRPNSIGISTVKLLSIKGRIIYISEVDMLEGTPLIDIKPFFEKFDNRFNTKAGWLDNFKDVDIKNIRSDKRFK